MKIREKIINELDELSPIDYLSVYEFIWSIKLHHQRIKRENPREHYFSEVSAALHNIEGDLTKDITSDREERT